MNVSVPKEVASGERRVALVPEVVERLIQNGMQVTIEAGAGAGAHHPNAAYEEAGASIGDGFSGDVIAKVAPPSAEEIARLGQGSVLVGFLQPLTASDTVRALAERGVTRVRVVPLFFGRGGHLREDFPRHLAAAKARLPEVEFAVTDEAGEDDGVLDALATFALEARPTNL